MRIIISRIPDPKISGDKVEKNRWAGMKRLWGEERPIKCVFEET
jgi:hypothetical protein